MTPAAGESAAFAAADAVRAIHAEFAVALGSDARVAAACETLRAERRTWSEPAIAERLRELAALVSGQAGPLVAPLFGLLEEIARGSLNPWPVLAPMLRVGPHDLAVRALDALVAAVDESRLVADDRLIASLAGIVETRGRPLTDPPAVERYAHLLGDSVQQRYLASSDPPTRRLAARVLDRTGHLPDASVAACVLGPEPHRFLAPYLDFTRATHQDLLAFPPAAEREPACLTSLRAAEARCGAPLLRELIASLGWPALNLGLEVRPLVGVSIGGGLPLLLAASEAEMFDGCPRAERVGARTLFIAHGERPEAASAATGADARIERFRASNLRHAEVLAELLDLAPLTRDRVQRLFDAVGALVADFAALFAGNADECRQVQAVFEGIRSRARDAEAAYNGPGVPPEVVRLVQPFEDPASIDAVRTLHGLKRYLHQRGLRLGFHLAQAGRSATRSIAIAVAQDGRVTRVVTPIEYADFDPDPAALRTDIPYSVRIAADGFAWQLLHGQDRLPSLRIYCYRNEVHYFISFRNHPAFVRIDYSPPFAGGMIDLEYYGVSKYELSQHPNVSLDGARAFFRKLDFDAAVDNTRIHARYDKERARDLADLCGRAEALFRLTPYLMDLDWVLGNLDLPREAREAATQAWADRFARWGVLPLGELLSANRLGIRLRDTPHPSGPRECTWRGDPPYRDRLTPESVADAVAWIRAALRTRGLDVPAAFGADDLAQISLEDTVLAPLREASATAGQAHDAARFAALAASGGMALVEGARLARVFGPLDRFLQFETVGYVNAHVVQRTRLPLPGRALRIAVVRDDSGALGLALADDVSGRVSRALDSGEAASVLRSHNFPVGDATSLDRASADAVSAWVALPGGDRAVRAVEGERIATGVRAAPGRAAGIARVGTAHRSPRDLEGAVLVADRLSPQDGPFLTRAAAVVCTGGGVLSHAGLLATQFGKPAVVLDARWSTAGDSAARVQFWSTDYDQASRTIGAFTVVERRGLSRREEWLLDGDVVEADADAGVVRVLGQDREPLALFDALRQLEIAETRLATASTPEQLLLERGRRAHALHLLGRLLPQLARPDLIAFAVRMLLSGRLPAAGSVSLLEALFHGRAPDAAHGAAEEWLNVVRARYERSDRAARQRVAASMDAFEILALRLALMRDADALHGARTMLEERPRIGPAAASRGDLDTQAVRRSLDRLALKRLTELRDLALRDLCRAVVCAAWPRARHTLDAVERYHRLLPAPASAARVVPDIRTRLSEQDRAATARCATRRVLTEADGGAELRPLVGPKASNLAEIVRLASDVPVPSWFAVTHAALEEALAVHVTDRGARLGDAISEVLGRPGLDEKQRSRAIERLWEELVWPKSLEDEIRSAYRTLAASAAADAAAPRDADGNLLVAVRSSAFEEDRPETMRAGEFDTFLFVGGEDAVLAHVRKAWSGFWTARAIHSRSLLGIGSRLPGGGILVQRMVDARSAGVVQTINVADGRPHELAIDVAFGLGEGVVSGRVAADHVTVVKEERRSGALRFRYATADKRDRIVFDRARGAGTYRADTLYHQRMRPALEYAELETLVHMVERLEELWCEALDLEFALDAERVWILQARPVPAFHASWDQTMRRYPFRQEASS